MLACGLQQYSIMEETQMRVDKKRAKRLEIRQEFERQSAAYTDRFGHPPVGADAFYVMLASIKEAGYVVQRARTKRPPEAKPQSREYEYGGSGRWPKRPPGC